MYENGDEFSNNTSADNIYQSEGKYTPLHISEETRMSLIEIIERVEFSMVEESIWWFKMEK